MAKLYFYYSAMDAGKTTTLLQSDHNYRARGMKTLLFIPAIGTRFQEGFIVSRIGLKAPAHPIQSEDDFLEIVQSITARESVACVLIDEAQFLTQTHVLQLARVVDQLNIPVLTYGLRTDFMGEPFEGSRYLLALADEIIEIKTVCSCGKKALMNVRIDQQGMPVFRGDQVEVGGNERYVALCRRHFFKAFYESTSSSLAASMAGGS